jgi:putative ABC transport system permease protein
MRPRHLLSALARETRGARGRMLFFVACLAVGVAAVVSVAGMSASLDEGIRGQARPLLAADLSVDGRRPLPEDLDDLLAEIGAAGRVDLVETVTVVAAPAAADGTPGPSQLVEVKAVGVEAATGGGYPFYGELVLEPARPLGELLGAESVVVAPDLLARLGLAAGDELRVGGEPFTIAGTVLAEPDNLRTGFTVGPRLFLSLGGLARADLVQAGSRVRYRALVRMPPDTGAEALTAAAERLREALAPAWDVESWREAQPSLRQGVARVDRFLGLVALLSLLVGGIGVAQTVRAWLADRLDAIAVLKCLGMRPREVLTLYLAHTLLLGLAGSLLGIAAGVAVQLALPHVFPDLIPAVLVRPFQPAALLRGLVLGLGVAVLFSVPPLVTALRVPPARVLRRDARPLPLARWAYLAAGGALAAGVVGMAALQARSLPLGLAFAGGLAAATLLLALAARLLVGAVGRLPHAARRRGGGSGGVWLRHGLSALARPGSGTLAAVVALGLGALVVLAMSLVERHLVAELDTDLPETAPSAFLVDVQPHQWEGVRRVLEEAGAEEIDSVPVVMARITAIDGQGAGELAPERDAAEATRPAEPGDEDDDDRRWALTREQRLTYMDELPEDNAVVQGELWSDPERAEVSVEEGFAHDLGVGLGSVLAFDVQGVPLELVVTSIRTVDWGTFGINFFLVVEPGVLDRAPQQRLAAVRLPRDATQGVQDLLAARYPNVTMVQIRDILEKIVAVLERIALAVRFLGGFTVLAGIAILVGAVSAAAARRGREVALLKTLGFTRAGVAAVFSVEYAAVGLVAGAIGAAGGGVLAWAVLTRGMEMEWSWFPVPFAVTLAGMVVLAIAGGLAASTGALRRRPIEVLRQET